MFPYVVRRSSPNVLLVVIQFKILISLLKKRKVSTIRLFWDRSQAILPLRWRDSSLGPEFPKGKKYKKVYRKESMKDQNKKELDRRKRKRKKLKWKKRIKKEKTEREEEGKKIERLREEKDWKTLKRRRKI